MHKHDFDDTFQGDYSGEVLEALRDESEPARYLRGCANAEDWKHARRVVSRIEDTLAEHMSDTVLEDITRMIVRQIAKGRTRGARDALLALGHSVEHLYEQERPAQESVVYRREYLGTFATDDGGTTE